MPIGLYSIKPCPKQRAIKIAQSHLSLSLLDLYLSEERRHHHHNHHLGKHLIAATLSVIHNKKRRESCCSRSRSQTKPTNIFSFGLRKSTSVGSHGLEARIALPKAICTLAFLYIALLSYYIPLCSLHHHHHEQQQQPRPTNKTLLLIPPTRLNISSKYNLPIVIHI